MCKLNKLLVIIVEKPFGAHFSKVKPYIGFDKEPSNGNQMKRSNNKTEK